MPKGKKFFKAAFAAVNVKKSAKKALTKKKELKKQLSSSGSEYSDGSSEYSSSEYSGSYESSEGGSSYTSDSDQEEKLTKPTPLKKEAPVPNKPSTAAYDDDSSDSSFSNGCGVYRRREDLTPDSSLASSSDDESSYEVESEYSSSQHSSSGEESDSDYSSEIEEPQHQQSKKSLNGKETIDASKSKVSGSRNVEESKKKSFFNKRLSFEKEASASKFRRPSSESRGSQESISEISRSSKASKSSKDSKVSESSSKKKKISLGGAFSKLKNKNAKSSSKSGSSDALDEDEGSSSEEDSSSSEDSYPSRSSKGSSKFSERSKSSTKYVDEDSLASSKYSRKSKSSDASRTSKANKSSKMSDSKNVQNGSTTPPLFDEDQLSMMRRGAGSNGGAGRGRGAQAGDGRGKPPLGRNKLGRQVNSEVEDEDDEPEDTFGSLLQKARSIRDMKATGEANNNNNSNIGPDAMKKYKDSAELSHSFKTQSLRNANANLRTSFTEEKQNDDTSDEKGSSSSRFAAMMRDLQSSSENTKPDTTPSNTSSDGDDNDDVHVFHAPKIVSDDDVPVEQGKYNGGSKSANESEDRRSRFRTRTESAQKLLISKSNNDESSASSGSEEGSDVEVDDEESDEDSTESNPEESFENDYSGDQPQEGSGNFHDDSSEEYSSDEEYYEEDQAMTILTPITEADNETIASTIKRTDDDSVNINSLISPKGSVDLGEQKTGDREESNDSSEGTIDSVSNTSSSGNVSNKNSQKGESSHSNGHHEPVIIGGQDKKYQQNGMSNQMSAAHVRMPEVERLSMSQVIARVKANDPTFTAINLDESDLNDFNATRLFFSLNGNEHITHISLALNSLGDGSAASLAHLLRENEHIIYLCLRGNQISDKGARAMGDAMEENRTLIHLDLHDNYVNSALLESVERGAPSTQMSLSTNSDRAEIEDSSYNTSRSAQSSIDTGAPEKSEKNHSIEKNLLIIDESVCASAVKGNSKIFNNAISSATESGERSVDEDALLLALSLSLCNLDSKWALYSAGETKTLGDRRRIAPWKTAELYKERESVTESISSDISGLADSEERVEERMESNSSNSTSWLQSFRKMDPRWQTRKCFNDISLFGGVLNDMHEMNPGKGSSIFTVWRPTSTEAIAKMMRGEGVGKGLEIKGKSAKEGDLSGFIPFLQIHKEEHKKGIRTIGKGDRTKIFFKKESWRDEVGEFLGNVAKEMTLSFTKSKFAMARSKYGCNPDAGHKEHYAWKAMGAELDDPKVTKIDDHAPQVFGIEVSCRVLWRGLVLRKDISRSPGSKFYTGRESQPAFQDMNFSALRLKEIDGPLPVLYQCANEDPFDARMLVMAYEEKGKVTPVVSDFDCFLIGTSNFHYSDPMPPEQVDLLDWCVSQIEWILESHAHPESWTTRWLEVLCFAAANDFCPSMPKFGFGDPTSQSMIEAAVTRLAKTNGAVRHGAECFNYFFPQEIDDHFLVVYPDNQIWKYVSTTELQDILREKVREGYTFPLNPKWLLCDPGWINLFKELLHSDEPSVRHSIDQWFPRDSGLRERILDISNRYPNGFESKDDATSESESIAEQKYQRYLVLQRAKRKVRSVIYWKGLLRDVRERATSDANTNCIDALQSLEFLGDKRQDLARVKSSKLESKTLKEIQNQSFFG